MRVVAALWAVGALSGCGCDDGAFADADGDGFGDALAPVCRVRDGVLDATDCDDADAAVHPEADEACDGVDNDCTGAIDEPFDGDGDGDSSCGADCDDADPRVAGHLVEICDRLDNDCDGLVDETTDGEIFDDDGDGWSVCRGDCDDADARRFPTHPEVCDGVDNDCDAETPEDEDRDGDGLTVCGGDCDDREESAFPGGEEICDTVDNDCDGIADEPLACSGCTEADGYVWCATYRKWSFAEAACAEAGYALVRFETPEENTAVSVAAYYRFYASSWIDLTDADTEGTWLWGDGTAATWSAWWDGEPNDWAGEDCAGTNYGDLGRWNDFNCKSTLPFVCE